MSLAKITPDVRKELELGDDAKGVIVFDIDEDGAAAKQGVQTGDIIASVGHDAVTTPEQVVDKIDQVRKAGRKSVLLRIERDGAAQFVAVPLDVKPAGGG
jgi:serine protease Do